MKPKRILLSLVWIKSFGNWSSNRAETNYFLDVQNDRSLQICPSAVGLWCWPNPRRNYMTMMVICLIGVCAQNRIQIQGQQESAYRGKGLLEEISSPLQFCTFVAFYKLLEIRLPDISRMWPLEQCNSSLIYLERFLKELVFLQRQIHSWIWCTMVLSPGQNAWLFSGKRQFPLLGKNGHIWLHRDPPAE